MAVINKVDAGQAIEWYKQGWQVFSKDMLTWALMALVMFVLSFVLSIIPLLGSAILVLLMPLFQAGMLYAVQKVKHHEKIEVGDLFAVFKDADKRKPLLVVGLLMLVAGIVVSILIGSSMPETSGAVSPMQATSLSDIGAGSLLIGFLALVFMSMLFTFAPALVLFEKMNAIDAVTNSFSASLKNFITFLLFILIYTVLVILGAIPLGLGLLVVVPWAVAANYHAYQDLFD